MAPMIPKQDSKGRWRCSDCRLTERKQTLLKIYGPNHKKIGKWSRAVKKLGTGLYGKNKYTGTTLNGELKVSYTNILNHTKLK